jgi:UrcA family protein
MKIMSKAARGAALVVVSVLAAGGVVSSVQASEIRIFVADLNLKSPEGQAAFLGRVDAAAREMCAGRERLRDMDHSVCIRAVREEAKENLGRALEKAAPKEEVSTAR